MGKRGRGSLGTVQGERKKEGISNKHINSLTGRQQPPVKYSAQYVLLNKLNNFITAGRLQSPTLSNTAI